MEALSKPSQAPPQFEPDTGRIKRYLLKKGVDPTPKIVHNLRKKEIQKHNRRAKRLADRSPNPPLTESQKQALAEESHFQTLRCEYRDFNRAVVGRPWERLDSVEIATLSAEYGGEKLKREELRELGQMFESRRREELRWVLDDDVELKEEWLEGEKRPWDPSKRRRCEAEVIRFLVDRFVFGTFQIFQILFTLIKFLSCL